MIDASVDTDLEAVTDVNRRILQAIAGRPVEYDRAESEALARRDDRVRLRLTPHATFVTPPTRKDDVPDLARLNYWTSATVPWDAE